MTDAKRQRCIIYVRQSLARQGETSEDSLSLEAQEARLRAYADSQGWVTTQAIRDHDLKGDDPQRPGVQEVLQLAKDQAADIVLVFAMSRFARDQVWQEITYRQLVAYKMRVVSLNEPNIEHTLFRGVLGVVNQYASEQTAQFVKAAFTRRVERGLTHGPAPYGYRKVLKQLYLDETEAAIVRKIYERWLAGDGVPTIAVALMNEGMTPRRSTTFGDYVIRNVLKNPVYAGFSHINGKRSPGAHEAIIDLETWERAQTLFGRRPRMRHTDRPSWCEGLVQHSCGDRMYLIPHKEPRNQDAGPVWEYVCRSTVKLKPMQCGQPRPRIVYWKLERAVREALVVDLDNLLTLDDVVEIARQTAGGADAEKARRDIERKRSIASARLQRAESMYLDGKRDHAWLALEEERASALLADLAKEESIIPSAVSREDLEGRAALFDQLADLIPDAPGSDLRLLVEQLGKIIVSGDGASLRYDQDIAGFIPSPAVIPFTNEVSPHRAKHPRTYAGHPTKRARE